MRDLAIEHHYAKIITMDGTPVRLRIVDTFPSRLASPAALMELVEEMGLFHGVVMVYDMGSASTLDTLKTFVDTFPLDALPITPHVAVVAAKADNEDARQVPAEDAQAWADQDLGGAECYEVSAKEDPYSVAEVFETLVRNIRDHDESRSDRCTIS